MLRQNTGSQHKYNLYIKHKIKTEGIEKGIRFHSFAVKNSRIDLSKGSFINYVTQTGKVGGLPWRYAKAYGVLHKGVTQGREEIRIWPKYFT